MPSLPSSKPLRLSDPARRDLAQIATLTGQKWGARQKKKYLDQIKEKLGLLRGRPGMGAPWDDIAKDLRACPAGRHLIFYREGTKTIDIVRILHESQDPAQRLEPQLRQ